MLEQLGLAAKLLQHFYTNDRPAKTTAFRRPALRRRKTARIERRTVLPVYFTVIVAASDNSELPFS